MSYGIGKRIGAFAALGAVLVGSPATNPLGAAVRTAAQQQREFYNPAERPRAVRWFRRKHPGRGRGRGGPMAQQAAMQRAEAKRRRRRERNIGLVRLGGFGPEGADIFWHADRAQAHHAMAR